MAKIYGLFGAMTGRVADVVMAISRGQQVVRKYQPVVTNPSTSLQVEQRAKMKLASQLAAALAPELKPYGSNGMVNSRNLFIKDMFNRGAITYNNNVAKVELSELRLTSSRVEGLMFVTATPTTTGVTVAGTVAPDYVGKILGVRVVAVIPRVASRDETEITIAQTATATINEGGFNVNLTYGKTFPSVVLVYGYWPESEAAVTKYQNMIAGGETPEVSLEVLRKQMASGLKYTLTFNRSVEAAS